MNNYQLFQLARYGNILKETPGDEILENGESEREAFEEWEQVNHELELINFDKD